MDEYSKVFKALGDETRLRIVHLLMNDEYCVGGLAKTLKITDSAVSQHLKVLKGVNLVDSKKHGYYTIYFVKKERLDTIVNEIKNWV
jgi:DNA-binding transcriptional ArsR family regulator